MERQGRSNRHFIKLLHSHVQHFSSVSFLGNTVLPFRTNPKHIWIKNVSTMSNTLFLFSLSYRQPGVSVNTEKTLQRSPHNWQNILVLLSTATSTEVQ